MARLLWVAFLLAAFAGSVHADPRDRDRDSSSPATLPTPSVVFTPSLTVDENANDITMELTVVSSGPQTPIDVYVEHRDYLVGLALPEFEDLGGSAEPFNNVWLWSGADKFSGTYATTKVVSWVVSTPFSTATWKRAGEGHIQCRFFIRYVSGASVVTSGPYYINEVVIDRDMSDTEPPEVTDAGPATVYSPFAFAPVAVVMNSVSVSETGPLADIAFQTRVLDGNNDVEFGGNTWTSTVFAQGVPVSGIYGYIYSTPSEAVAAGMYMWRLQVRFMDVSGNVSNWETLYTLDMRDYD